MITIIPIEPISEAHAALIVEAFNKLFIDRGGKEDGDGNGDGYGDGWRSGNGYGYGNGIADCWGDGRGTGYGDPRGDGGKWPESWRAD